MSAQKQSAQQFLTEEEEKLLPVWGFPPVGGVTRTTRSPVEPGGAVIM